MRAILVILLTVCFVMSGYAVSGAKGVKGFDVYTFKKERVDQAVRGNRGYIMGAPPQTTCPERSSMRTLIGVDIELPSFVSGKDEETQVVQKEETGTLEAAQRRQRELERQKRTGGTAGCETTEYVQQQKQQQPRIVEEDIVEEEDEWIK